jgi:transposase-like protein
MVLEDKIRRTVPIGSIDLTCPFCKRSLAMNCYRVAEGPFGTRKALHFLCPSCQGIWSVAKEDEGRILASIDQHGGTGPDH